MCAISQTFYKHNYRTWNTVAILAILSLVHQICGIYITVGDRENTCIVYSNGECLG